MATNELLEELNEFYRQWKGEFKARTYAELARQSKVGYFETRRALQGEIKPVFKIISPLLEVMAPEQAMTFYKKHFNEEFNLIMKMASQQSKCLIEENSSKIKFFDERLMTFIADASYFPIIALLACSGDDGLARNIIKENYGEQGVSCLNQLVEQDIVKLNTKDEVMLADYNITTNVKFVLKMMEQAANLMSSNPKAFAFIGFEMVNDAALATIFSLYKETELKIMAILKDKSSRGNIPINWGGVLGRVGTSLIQSNSTHDSGKGE